MKYIVFLFLFALVGCGDYSDKTIDPQILFALTLSKGSRPTVFHCAKIVKNTNIRYPFNVSIFGVSSKEQCNQSTILGSTASEALEIEKNNLNKIITILNETDKRLKASSTAGKDCTDALTQANQDLSNLQSSNFANVSNTVVQPIENGLQEAIDSVKQQLTPYPNPEAIANSATLATIEQQLVYRTSLYSLINKVNGDTKDCSSYLFGKYRYLAQMPEYDPLRLSKAPLLNVVNCVYGAPNTVLPEVVEGLCKSLNYQF